MFYVYQPAVNCAWSIQQTLLIWL